MMARMFSESLVIPTLLKTESSSMFSTSFASSVNLFHAYLSGASTHSYKTCHIRKSRFHYIARGLAMLGMMSLIAADPYIALIALIVGYGRYTVSLEFYEDS